MGRSPAASSTTLPGRMAPDLTDLVQGDLSPGEPNKRYAGEEWLTLSTLPERRERSAPK